MDLKVLNLNEKRSIDPEPTRDSWKKAYGLYLQAFKEPKTIQEQKKLAKLLKKPLPADVEHDLFDYSLGFLRGLGMMSLSKYYFLLSIPARPKQKQSLPNLTFRNRRSRGTRRLIHSPCTFEPFLPSQRLRTSPRPT